jgi:hypothetical protein
MARANNDFFRLFRGAFMLCALCSVPLLADAATVGRVGAATAAPRGTTITPGSTIAGGSTIGASRAASAPAPSTAARAAAAAPVRAASTTSTAPGGDAANARRSSVYSYIRNHAAGGISTSGGAAGGADFDVALRGFASQEQLDQMADAIRALQDELDGLEIPDEDMIDAMIARILKEMEFDFNMYEGPGINIDPTKNEVSVRIGEGLKIDNNDAIAVDMDALPMPQFDLTAGSGISINNVNNEISVRVGDGLLVHNGQVVVDMDALPTPQPDLIAGSGISINNVNNEISVRVGDGLLVSNGQVAIDWDLMPDNNILCGPNQLRITNNAGIEVCADIIY